MTVKSLSDDYLMTLLWLCNAFETNGSVKVPCQSWLIIKIFDLKDLIYIGMNLVQYKTETAE